MKTRGLLKGLIVLSLMISLTACKKNEDDKPLEADEFLDVSYGADVENTLDVYLPEGRTDTTKVIFLVHGGFWSVGDKEELLDLALALQDSGFAVVNLNYRLTSNPDNVHPAQQQDIAAAINYVASKVNDWRVSSSKFGMWGVSAGGHLALLYTYANNANNKIKTVVSLAGPTNLTDRTDITYIQSDAVEAFVGESFDSANPSAYIQVSPLAKVNAFSKPTLLIYGDDDLIVPPSQSTHLGAKLDMNGVNHKLVPVAAGHDLLNASDIVKAQILFETVNWFNTEM